MDGGQGGGVGGGGEASPDIITAGKIKGQQRLAANRSLEYCNVDYSIVSTN